ncbi:MAG: NAD-dependent deacetylase [Raineya sp.]|jgi:NAD-dependent deacetylase|nr:NAD-dependent deacetylase [Raineya sp.]
MDIEILENAIKEVFKKKKKNLFTFLTGAGISADSGIPTYRGVDGIWVKGSTFHRPEEFGTYSYFLREPEEVWQYNLFRKKMFENALPNNNHFGIVEIEGLLEDQFQLITQNIDGLHLRAGSKRVFEIHGNTREVKCSKVCNSILPFPKNVKSKELKEDLSEEEIQGLKCPTCGNWLRPNILWFDEYYDEKTHKKASSLKVAKNTGILFIIGTSGATTLPLRIAHTALQYGAYIVDLNIEDNYFTKLLENKKRAIIIRNEIKTALPIIKDLIEKNIPKN